jgi:hypothetical protein
LNLLSHGFTIPPIIFIDAIEENEEEEEDVDLFECSIYDKRGWLGTSVPSPHSKPQNPAIPTHLISMISNPY